MINKAGAARSSRRRAIVIGGSVSGLAIALLLRRRGWRADVFERVGGDQRGRGAGIVTHPELFDVLDEIGISAERIPGERVTVRRMLSRDGGVEHEVPFPQLTTSWAVVYAALAEAAGVEGFHGDRELVGVDEGSKSVVARFADGSSVEGDVLIGADGFRSTVRRHILPDVTPLYAGYITWRGLAPFAAVSPLTRETAFDEFCFCLPEHEQIAGYPVSLGGNGADRLYNFVWYRPADRAALDDFLTDAAGKYHALGIPPPLVRATHISRMRADAASRLAPQFADIVASTREPFFQPIYDLESPVMSQGRVVVIGDAAFVARPHVGAGVTKALQDASALAHALDQSGDIETALDSFSKQRTRVGGSIVSMARRLGAYMQAERCTEQERLSAMRYRDADAVMRDSASLNFLSAS